MEMYKDLVKDLRPYKKYLPMLEQYFTVNPNERRIRDEIIRLFACKTDEEVAASMMYSRNTLLRGGYTWQFNKEALKDFVTSLVTECKKQQKWTKEQWMAVAFNTANLLVQQRDEVLAERSKLEQAIAVAGYVAERGADKARLTARDTKTRLRDFSKATRKLQRKSKGITDKDIQKLETILNGEHTNGYQH